MCTDAKSCSDAVDFAAVSLSDNAEEDILEDADESADEDKNEDGSADEDKGEVLFFDDLVVLFDD